MVTLRIDRQAKALPLLGWGAGPMEKNGQPALVKLQFALLLQRLSSYVTSSKHESDQGAVAKGLSSHSHERPLSKSATLACARQPFFKFGDFSLPQRNPPLWGWRSGWL